MDDPTDQQPEMNMTNAIARISRRMMGGTAIALLALAYVAAPAVIDGGTGHLGALAFAKNGGDDGRGDDGGGRGRGGDDGADRGDDNGGDRGDRGRGSDDGAERGSDDGGKGRGRGGDDARDDSDDSGQGRGRGRGRGRGGDDDSIDDSSSDDSAGKSNRNRGGRADRPEITISLTDAQLASIQGGSKVLVDNLGRLLEVEIEFEHGVRTISVKPHGGDARRNPGPIKSVNIVPAGSVVHN
jgi:hypothetical protein